MLTALFAGAARLPADVGRCRICGGEFGDTVYTVTDKVTRETKEACRSCVLHPDLCFLCGLPVRKDFTALPDGRFICSRDARTAVLDDVEAKRICEQVRDDLDRLFSRFLSFPATNVDIAIVDRVSLMEFKVPGNDFTCPNLLGYLRPQEEDGRIRHQMSLMSALPRAEFKSTCAHEFTHAWVLENLSPARRKTLGRDAHEGFCELVAYLLMDSQQEGAQKATILQNRYTRGQIDLFIQAERRYGFNDIVDWMKYGVDAVLDKDDLVRVRNVEIPRPRSKSASAYGAVFPVERPIRIPDTLVLRAISALPNRPVALINDLSLTVGESGSVHVGKTNIQVRCLGIGENWVRIQLVGSGEQVELRFKTPELR